MSTEKDKSWHTDFAQKIAINPGKKPISQERLTGKKLDKDKTKEEK